MKQQLIEKARRGERLTKAEARHSLLDAERDFGPHVCTRRVIACDNEHDVVECHLCGRQWVSACSFDDDYS